MVMRPISTRRRGEMQRQHEDRSPIQVNGWECEEEMVPEGVENLVRIEDRRCLEKGRTNPLPIPIPIPGIPPIPAPAPGPLIIGLIPIQGIPPLIAPIPPIAPIPAIPPIAPILPMGPILGPACIPPMGVPIIDMPIPA